MCSRTVCFPSLMAPRSGLRIPLYGWVECVKLPRMILPLLLGLQSTRPSFGPGSTSRFGAIGRAANFEISKLTVVYASVWPDEHHNHPYILCQTISTSSFEVRVVSPCTDYPPSRRPRSASYSKVSIRSRSLPSTPIQVESLKVMPPSSPPSLPQHPSNPRPVRLL